MHFRTSNWFDSSQSSASCNMTPIIDIVFLLIIFFMVVCQFIEAENFPVEVPDECAFAQTNETPGRGITTVTVIKNPDDKISSFAVGSQQISASNYTEITQRLTELIDMRLKDTDPDRRIVNLRIDRQVEFHEAQYVLAAVAESSATDIQLAVFKDTHSARQ